jgi:sterol desaturase/sphingolipid hydroxylase (fatty acid hydroxylase superfamily)
MQTLVRLVIGLVFLGAFFYLLEMCAGRRRPFLTLRQGFLTDLTYWLATPFVKVLVRAAMIIPAGLLVVLHLATPAELKAGLYTGFGPLAMQPVWLQAIEIYLLVDLGGYWIHRLFHTGSWWPFHAVHHSSKEVDWFSSVRVHPVNELVDRLVQATPVLLLGFNPTVTLGSAPVLTLYAIFLHANLDWDLGPLRAVVASPVFHRWHHSNEPEARNKNFAGLFPIWDLFYAAGQKTGHIRNRRTDARGVPLPALGPFLDAQKPPRFDKHCFPLGVSI